jgi:aminomethyltransferase
MSQRTHLYDVHVAAGAKVVPFAGWDMPLNYGSQIEEHKAVRERAGLFDVSHMTIVDFPGTNAEPLLSRLVANDVGRLGTSGRAIYGVLLNEQGGIIDDLIVYRRHVGYRAVTNAGTRDKVLPWLTKHAAAAKVELRERRDLAMIALQGPLAIDHLQRLTGVDAAILSSFAAIERDGWMVARTGYTGEDGVELILPGADARKLWTDLVHAGVAQCGLAARDTLRLEAGLNLYGQDMDETTNPLESNLAWTIAWDPQDRDFIGRTALEAVRAQGAERKLTGLVLEGKGVMRHEQRVVTPHGDGVITSGIFSPTLGYSIALARVPRRATGEVQVDIRGKLNAARIVRPPFVRRGEKVFT